MLSSRQEKRKIEKELPALRDSHVNWAHNEMMSKFRIEGLDPPAQEEQTEELKETKTAKCTFFKKE